MGKGQVNSKAPAKKGTRPDAKPREKKLLESVKAKTSDQAGSDSNPIPIQVVPRAKEAKKYPTVTIEGKKIQLKATWFPPFGAPLSRAYMGGSVALNAAVLSDVSGKYDACFLTDNDVKGKDPMIHRMQLIHDPDSGDFNVETWKGYLCHVKSGDNSLSKNTIRQRTLKAAVKQFEKKFKELLGFEWESRKMATATSTKDSAVFLELENNV